MTPTEQTAFNQMRDALEDLIEAGSEAWGEDRPCVRIAREALAAAKEVQSASNASNAARRAMVAEMDMNDRVLAAIDSEPRAHYEEQPDGTVIPVDPSEMQPQAQGNEGLKKFLSAAKDAGITHWTDELTGKLIGALCQASEPQAQDDAVISRNQALEDAAKICESEYDNWDNERPLRICVTAIRNMKDKP